MSIERRKASEDAVNKRLQKLKKEKLAKAKRNTELAKAADIGPKDFNLKKDSTSTSIKKEMKYAVSGPQTQRQRLHRKASELRKKAKNISKFQNEISDPKSKLVESTREYKETIPKAMGGYKSGGLALRGYGKAYMKGGRVK